MNKQLLLTSILGALFLLGTTVLVISQTTVIPPLNDEDEPCSYAYLVYKGRWEGKGWVITNNCEESYKFTYFNNEPDNKITLTTPCLLPGYSDAPLEFPYNDVIIQYIREERC